MQQLGCESHSVTCVSCYVHVYGNKVIIIITPLVKVLQLPLSDCDLESHIMESRIKIKYDTV